MGCREARWVINGELVRIYPWLDHLMAETLIKAHENGTLPIPPMCRASRRRYLQSNEASSATDEEDDTVDVILPPAKKPPTKRRARPS